MIKKHFAVYLLSLVSLVLLITVVVLIISRPSSSENSKSEEGASVDTSRSFNTDSTPPNNAHSDHGATVESEESDEQDNLSPAQLYEQYADAVVSIEAYSPDGSILQSDGILLGTGSGFFISSTGLIATNYHVIEGATRLVVKTSNEQRVEVQNVFAYSEANDLAILKLDATPSVYLKLSDREIMPGSDVSIIGNPLGLQRSISTGVIMGARNHQASDSIKPVSLIQFSAPISPGSSGSPVISQYGDVIGVVSFHYAEGQNLNFAIESSHLIDLVQNVPYKLTVRELYARTHLRSQRIFAPADPDTVFIKLNIVANPFNSVPGDPPSFTRHEQRAASQFRAQLEQGGGVIIEDDDAEMFADIEVFMRFMNSTEEQIDFELVCEIPVDLNVLLNGLIEDRSSRAIAIERTRGTRLVVSHNRWQSLPDEFSISRNMSFHARMILEDARYRLDMANIHE